MVSRVGIIGDVHAHAERLETALKTLRASNVDSLWCVGDVVDGAGDAERCCQLLQDFEVLTVRGNHDRWFLTGELRDLPNVTLSERLSESSRAWLHSLPPTHEFETVAGRVLLCHGLGENDMARLSPDDYGYGLVNNLDLQRLLRNTMLRFVICGHTHRLMVRSFDGLTIINVGALSETKVPCFAIADVLRRFVTFHDFEGNSTRFVL